jgi:hypothetical protein
MPGPSTRDPQAIAGMTRLRRCGRALSSRRHGTGMRRLARGSVGAVSLAGSSSDPHGCERGHGDGGTAQVSDAHQARQLEANRRSRSTWPGHRSTIAKQACTEIRRGTQDLLNHGRCFWTTMYRIRILGMVGSFPKNAGSLKRWKMFLDNYVQNPNTRNGRIFPKKPSRKSGTLGWR